MGGWGWLPNWGDVSWSPGVSQSKYDQRPLLAQELSVTGL